MDSGGEDGNAGSYFERIGLDGTGGWLLSLAMVDLCALGLHEVLNTSGPFGSGGSLLAAASNAALAAAVVAGLALLPVVGHGFFGAGWSGGGLGKRSSRVAPVGLIVSLLLLFAAAGLAVGATVL